MNKIIVDDVLREKLNGLHEPWLCVTNTAEPLRSLLRLLMQLFTTL